MEEARAPVPDTDIDAIFDTVIAGRSPSADDLTRVREAVAAAPFDERAVAVPRVHRRLDLGDVTLGERAMSLHYHLAVRVLVDRQWSVHTTAVEYLHDLRSVIRDAASSIVFYTRRGGRIIGFFGNNRMPPDRRGPDSLPWMYVVYSVDRARIVTGYQVSGVHRLSIPDGARWFR